MLMCLIVKSTDSLTMPQSCFPEAELTTFAFSSGEVKKLLLELDPYGGAGPDGIFPLFFTKTANCLAPKISTVLCKLVRIGGVSMCWELVISHQFLSLALPILVPLTIVEQITAKYHKNLSFLETSTKIGTHTP